MYLKGEDYDLQENQMFDTHYRILQGLDEDSLMIIDNYNTLPEENKLLRKFVNHRFKTIFTTRMHIKGFPTLEVQEIKDMEILLELFKHYHKYKAREKDTIQSIIQEIHSHTLTVEMVARTLHAASISPKKLLLQLVANGFRIQNEEEITITKDEEDKTAVMYQHIRMLFNLHGLNRKLTDSMMNLSLIPPSGVEKDLFSAWRKKKNNNDINKLVRLGWINEDDSERKLYIHPIVQEVVKGETTPSTIKCRDLLESIHNLCLLHGQDVDYYQMLFSMVMSIIEKIHVDDSAYWILFLEDAFSYMDKYGDYTNMSQILKELDDILRTPNMGTKEDIALILSYKAQIRYISRDYDKAVKRQKQALKFIPEINNENAHLHSNLHSNMGLYYLHKKKFSDAEEHMKQATEILKDYNLLECHDIIPQLSNYGSLLLEQGDAKKALYYFEVSKKLVIDYLGTDNSDYGIVLKYIGIAYVGLREFDLALECFVEAQRVLANIFAPNHPEIQLLQKYISEGTLMLGVKKAIERMEN